MRSLAGRQILVGLAGVLALAQAPAVPEFEVATVKSSPPPAGDLININIGGFRNGKLTFANASLSDCLKFAWGIVSDEQIAGPDWIKSKTVRFDTSRRPHPAPHGSKLEPMLQALLAERLKLAIHDERKELSFLALIPGKNGVKLHAANPDSAASGNNLAARGQIASKYMSMKVLATLLSHFEREIVVDQTGTAGPFEIKLDWSPDDGVAQATNDVPPGPSVYTALQEQLGLRLESRKGPLDVLVIDHAEKVPVDN
jgi:uncharacterized protein (TIGR03435 family)